MPVFETLEEKELTRIITTAEPILRWIIEHEDHQNGGVLIIADLNTGIPLLIYGVGGMTSDEYGECLMFGSEKAKRLADNPLDHTSGQSRDMTTTPKRYAGAIRGRRFILSFSGFKEEQDEATMCYLEIALNGGFQEAPLWLIECVRENTYFATLHVGVMESEL